MLGLYAHMAPLGRNVTHEEVGRTGAFLLSDYSDGITGEILHVDGGYNAMGSPGRLLDVVRAASEPNTASANSTEPPSSGPSAAEPSA